MLTRIKLFLNLPLTKKEALNLTATARNYQRLKYEKEEIKQTIHRINLAAQAGLYYYKVPDLQPSTVRAVEALGYTVTSDQTTYLTYYIITWN